MAKNRELSQVGHLEKVNDTTGQIGIANSVGINTTTPQGSYALYVQGTTNVTGAINSETDVQVGGTSVLTSAQNDAVALAIALG